MIIPTGDLMKEKETKKGGIPFFETIRQSRAAKLLYDSGAVSFILAFLIPAAIMLYAFWKQSIHPFGDRQMLVVDLWHQYYPFFQVVREKLINGGSFLYSWETGMGTNFLGLIAYYAMSPLNWLAVFFDEENTRDAMTYFLIAKIGFSGAFYSLFLRYTYRHKDLSVVVFSTMFALCSYMLGYYWNVMWFDTVAVFPLVMTGVVALCREGKWKLYTVSLALSLIFNYYIGYMVCIFTVFMFAAAFIIEGRGVKDFFVKLWLIVRSSVLGIGLGAFILIPAYKALQMAYQSTLIVTFKPFDWMDKWTDMLAGLMSYREPSTVDGLPNLACGMLAVVLFGVFVFSGGIKLKEKIMSLFVLILITLSLNHHYLEYVWHGFHRTNQLPHRNAFIFSFVLVALAYRAYDVMLARGIRLTQLIMLLGGPALVFGMRYLSDTRDGGAFSFDDKTVKSSLFIAVAYVMIFAAVKFLPIRSSVTRRTILNIALAVTVFSELVKNAGIGAATVGTSAYNSYPVNNAGAQSALSLMREQEDDPLFYRTEMTSNYTLNDGALYGYNGVSQFSSTANVSMTKFIKRLGMYAAENGNRYYYRNSPPTVNELLGIQYVISKSGTMNSNAAFFEQTEAGNNGYLYRSKYPLSIGFMMDSAILGMSDENVDNPFEYQNILFRLASGVSDSIFEAQPVMMATYDNIEVTKKGFGKYEYKLTDKNKDAKCKYEFEGLADGVLYGYARNGAFDKIVGRSDDSPVDSGAETKSYPIVFPLGNGQEGSVLSFNFTINAATDEKPSGRGSYNVMAYALKIPAFEKCYDALADEQLEITEFSDTEIKGEIDVKERGVLYLSIPYEKGWTIYVDGEKTRSMAVLDAMLGTEISSGHHEIVLKYSPDGFRTGLLISGGSVILLIVLVLCDRRSRKKKNTVIAELPVEKKSEMDDISDAQISMDQGQYRPSEENGQINEKS